MVYSRNSRKIPLVADIKQKKITFPQKKTRETSRITKAAIIVSNKKQILASRKRKISKSEK